MMITEHKLQMTLYFILFGIEYVKHNMKWFFLFAKAWIVVIFCPSIGAITVVLLPFYGQYSIVVYHLFFE